MRQFTASRIQSERADYIKTNWILTWSELSAMNEIITSYINDQPIDESYFKVYRNLVDKYNL